MLDVIKAHLESIRKKGKLATLSKIDALAFPIGLETIRDTLLSQTINKEVGGVLLFDPKNDKLHVDDIAIGSESSINIKFPKSANYKSMLVIGDVHTHPPTTHDKTTVYQAPSYEDMRTAAERTLSTEPVFKYYFLSLVATQEGVYAMFPGEPLGGQAVQKINSKEIQTELMFYFDNRPFELVTGVRRSDMAYTVFTQRYSHEEYKNLDQVVLQQTNFKKLLQPSMTKIKDEVLTDLATFFFEMSLSQFTYGFAGTKLIPRYGRWYGKDRLEPITSAKQASVIKSTFDQNIQKAAKGKFDNFSKVSSPDQGKLSSSSHGLRCSICLQVHQSTLSSPFNRWHTCRSCRAVYCGSCGSKLATEYTSTFSIVKQAKCKHYSFCKGHTEMLY